MLEYSINDTDNVGASLARVLKPGDAVGLSGDLGAGKTTLARAILKALGLEGEAPSPTFAIVQPYAPPETVYPLLHVDLFRLDDPEEVLELGLDEARADHILLIEWPDRLGQYSWADMVQLHIEFAGVDARRLTARLPDAWEHKWPFP